MPWSFAWSVGRKRQVFLAIPNFFAFTLLNALLFHGRGTVQCIHYRGECFWTGIRKLVLDTADRLLCGKSLVSASNRISGQVVVHQWGYPTSAYAVLVMFAWLKRYVKSTAFLWFPCVLQFSHIWLSVVSRNCKISDCAMNRVMHTKTDDYFCMTCQSQQSSKPNNFRPRACVGSIHYQAWLSLWRIWEAFISRFSQYNKGESQQRNWYLGRCSELENSNSDSPATMKQRHVSDCLTCKDHFAGRLSFTKQNCTVALGCPDVFCDKTAILSAVLGDNICYFGQQTTQHISMRNPRTH